MTKPMPGTNKNDTNTVKHYSGLHRSFVLQFPGVGKANPHPKGEKPTEGKYRINNNTQTTHQNVKIFRICITGTS